MMGAPGTARWIAAQKAARARLRREAVDRVLRRIAIGGLILIVLALVAPYAVACDVPPSDAMGATLGVVFLIGLACGVVAGFVGAVMYCAWRMSAPR